MNRCIFEQVIIYLEGIEDDFYHEIGKKNLQIRDLQETIKKQGQIIEKLKTELKK